MSAICGRTPPTCSRWSAWSCGETISPSARRRGGRVISEPALEQTVGRLNPIFRERSLRITPAYVRRLIDSVISLKGGFAPEYLDDQFLVRDALQAVAKNVYGSLFKKVVAQMDRSVRWEDYIGGIKNEFSEMANNALFYNVSEEKGVVLTGPPGSGKTFMVRAWLGDNREVQDLVVNLNDLTDPTNPLEGMVENLERVYDIAKMLSPSMVFFDEGDAVAPRRSAQGGSPYDKVTNKFLSIIDGESPLSRVFTVLTTNRLDILDPALIRSKRLKVLSVTGHMRDDDALRILRKEIQDIPLEEGLSYEELVRVAHNLCETPADFTAFGEKLRSLRSTEMEVLGKLMEAVAGSEQERARFVRFNYKTLIGLLEGAAGESSLALRARHGEEGLLECLDEAAARLKKVKEAGVYPVTRWHLHSARQQFGASPTRKGKQQLDEFLETELSQEPQVGFVVGVGANDTSGILLPIASSLVYRVYPEKILVTGAVSSNAPGAAELDLAVQMTHQSAREALTLVENYLQDLCPDAQRLPGSGGVSRRLHPASPAAVGLLQRGRPLGRLRPGDQHPLGDSRTCPFSTTSVSPGPPGSRGRSAARWGPRSSSAGTGKRRKRSCSTWTGCTCRCRTTSIWSPRCWRPTASRGVTSAGCAASPPWFPRSTSSTICSSAACSTFCACAWKKT